jgi:hypothetical protein
MSQPYDPVFPTGRPPGGPRPADTAAQEQKKRLFWSQSRSFTIAPGGPETAIMTLPASTAIDVMIQYRQPGQNPTIVSPDGREVYNLYAQEQLFSRILASFTPGGHVPGFGGDSLPPVGRVFAVRDFPADGWDLKIDTTNMVADPDAPPTLIIDVTCQGWAREPTGIGPLELETLAAAVEKTDRLLTFVPTGGLTDVDVGTPTFGIVQVYNLVDPWTPSNSDLAGAANVIMCGVDPDTFDITPIFTTPSGGIASDPTPETTNFTTALAGSLVVRDRGCIIMAASGRIDSTATTGTYYVQLWNLDAVPANGTAVTTGNGAIAAPIKIQHSSGADDYFDFELPDGYDADTGFTITLSSTEFTKSASPGNFMSATGAYKDFA